MLGHHSEGSAPPLTRAARESLARLRREDRDPELQALLQAKPLPPRPKKAHS